MVHCHGWFSALAPLYQKGYADDPCFKEAKVICSLYDEEMKKPFNMRTADKLRFEGIGEPEIEKVKARGSMDYANLMKLAIDFSDGIILGSDTINPDLKVYLDELKTPVLPSRLISTATRIASTPSTTRSWGNQTVHAIHNSPT